MKKPPWFVWDLHKTTCYNIRWVRKFDLTKVIDGSWMVTLSMGDGACHSVANLLTRDAAKDWLEKLLESIK